MCHGDTSIRPNRNLRHSSQAVPLRAGGASIRFAAEGMERVVKSDPPAVPGLTRMLRTEHDIKASTALKSIGPAAITAAPALKRKARKSDPAGRDQATSALRRIETAAKPAPRKKPKQ